MRLDGTLLSPLFDQFPEPVFVVGDDGLLNYCNPAGRELFPKSAPGLPCPPEIATLLAREGPMAACYSKNGKSYDLSVTTLGQGKLVVLRPGLDSPLSADGLNRFTVALRQQVASLSAALQQMEGLYRGKETQGVRWRALIQQSVHRLLRSIGELELNRALLGEEKSLNCRFGPLDLAGLCLQLGREVESLARQAGVDFQVDCQAASILTTGDGALLRRMLLGLISNAMKAAGPGGKAGLRLSATQERAIIAVWDNGPGMEEARLASLFQGGAVSRLPRPEEGAGLGLLLVRQIVSLHDGVLLMESREGQGVTATVALPVRTSKTLPLHSPISQSDFYGGFSPLLVELSDVLPWQVFLSEDLEE